MPAAEFEAYVATALDTIPPDLAVLIDNCVVLVEDDPPDNGRRTRWGCTPERR